MIPNQLNARLSSQTPKHPPLTVRQVAFTLLYVLPFYLSPTTRPSQSLSRDAPTVIRKRIHFVTISCTISAFITIRILANYTHAPLLEIFRLLGWYPISFVYIAKPLALTAILFAGPLFEKGVVESGWREWIRGRPLYDCLSSWPGWRNYVAVS